MLQKIISGGQTGADRAALDAALAADFPCGGFCPKHRQAEDGPIDPQYPLIEFEGGYPERTEQNVIQSDGTVIFYDSEPTGGTQLTIDFCETHGKPHVLIDISNFPRQSATRKINNLIQDYSIAILNIAGSRASECPDIYIYVFLSLSSILDH